MRYWLGPNTLGGMEGSPIHLSFNIGVPCCKMGIILLMCSQVLGGGTPIASDSILRNNMSHAVDRQWLCLPSLNVQTNSLKAVVLVRIWPSLLLNTGVVYEFDFDLLSDVAVNQVIPPSGDSIGISSLKFFTNKTTSVVLMPIVFVDKGQTPKRTISFSSILFL